MFSTNIVIVLLSFGSVLMDSNLKEFCSKTYFHSFSTNRSNEGTALELTRKVDSSQTTHHSWNLMIEKDFSEDLENNKTTNISYILKVGQTPNISLTQPKDCPIHYTIIRNKTYNWTLNGFQITNHIKGPEVHYTQYSLKGQLSPNSGKETLEPIREDKNSSLNMPGIWFSGLLCIVPDKTIYAIVEERSSMNASNRTQFMSRLRINKIETNHSDYWTTSVTTSLQFSFESTNKTIIDFFGIDCPDTEEDYYYSVTTESLVLIFWFLVFSAIILSFTDIFLIFKRRKTNKRRKRRPKNGHSTSSGTVLSGSVSSTAKKLSRYTDSS